MRSEIAKTMGGDYVAVLKLSSKELDVLYDALYYYEKELNSGGKYERVRATLDEVYHLSNEIFKAENEESNDE